MSAVAIVLTSATPAAFAEDIRVLSAAAMQSVLKEVGSEFERSSGHRLVINYGTMGAINQRVLDGETSDLIIGSSQSIAGLVKAGRINADSQLAIAKVGIGIVVPATSRVPRISTPDELAQALRDAKTVVFANPAGGGAAGIHIAGVIEKLRLGEELKSKIKLGAGGDVTEVMLAQGDGALGMTQISEIVGKPGAVLVGPLPEPLQNYTGVTAGTPIGVAHSEAVAVFLAFLKGPIVGAALRAKGMQVQ